MIKKILFILNSRLSYLPPFLALLDYLIDSRLYDITVIAAESEHNTYKEYADKIHIINYYNGRTNSGFVEKIRIRFCQTLYYYYRLRKDLKKIPYDILWVVHVNSILPARGLFKGRKYIFSDYEWYDHDKSRYKASRFAERHATINVVCEENRAWLAKCNFNLKELPFVLPNKMWRKYNGETLGALLPDLLKNKKIILYQGILHKERPIDALCDAVSNMPEFCLLLLGAESSYSKELLNRYQNVYFHPFVTPPHHLAVTKQAYIGIVVYDGDNRLNCAYCAPNKIWEYSMYDIPMLYNNIPGLKYTIGTYKAGEVISFKDIESIKHAIYKIDNNYDMYRNGSALFYHSCNIGIIIDKILEKYEKS